MAPVIERIAELRLDTMRSLGLLTRLHVSSRWFAGFDGRFDRSARAFPIVGALLGALVAAVAVAATLAGLPRLAAAVLATVVGIVTTGGLHEDGLADSADALGGRDRVRRLAIMRDSAIGSYGVLALLLAVGLKVTLLGALLGDAVAAALALVAASAGARAAMVWLWAATPPARTDGAAAGSGHPTMRSARTAAVLAALIAMPALAWLGPWRMLVAVALVVIVVVALRGWAVRALGGHTGDVLGACVILVEGAILLGLATGGAGADMLAR